MTSSAKIDLSSVKTFEAEPPLPLTRPTAESAPYPYQELGPRLTPVVEAIQRKIKAPMALCAHSVLAVASYVVQGRADVRLPHGQVRPTSLFLISVAASGERKSSADGEAMKPILRYQKALRLTYDDQRADFDLRNAAHQSQEKKVLNGKCESVDERIEKLRDVGEAPVPPLLYIIVATEPTIEALFKLLDQSQPSMALFSDEGGQMLQGHSMSAEKKVHAAGGLSNFWDGKEVTRARILDGNTHLRGKRVALHLMIQPQIAADFFNDAALKDQGLHSRILTSAPPSSVGFRLFEAPRAEDIATIDGFDSYIFDLLNNPLNFEEGEGNALDLPALELNDDAARLWIDLANELDSNSAKGQRWHSIASFANKSAEHAARIAAVLSYIDNPSASEISGDHMKRGIALVRYYLTETVRLSDGAKIGQELTMAQELLDWLKNQYGPGGVFPLIDVYQRGPNAIRKKGLAIKHLKILEDHRWITQLDPQEVDGKTRQEVWQLRSEV